MNSKNALPAYFLGKPEEVCIVSPDIKKSMTGLIKLGIGPWKVYTFDPGTVSDQTYYGKPAKWALRVAFAKPDDLIWEIMQPLWGPSIMADFLESNGEGIQHIAFDLDGLPWEERLAEFTRRGFPVAQSGVWAGKCRFAFYDTQAVTGMCFESYLFDDDWVDPEPDYCFPE